MMDNIIDRLFPFVAGLFALVVLYAFFVLLPTVVYAESACLKAGYPEAKVTFFLDVYCVGIDGAVDNRVTPLDEAEGGGT